VRLIGALDRNRRVTAVPYQKPGAPEAHGLSPEQCREAAWAVTLEGRPCRGAGAVNLALAVALGNRLPVLFYSAPGVRQLQDAAYRWVARNRRRLPGDTPYCRQRPEECR
jgi:predicted DCC family thiol-disulfide oxidoreductase YuxK